MKTDSGKGMATKVTVLNPRLRQTIVKYSQHVLVTMQIEEEFKVLFRESKIGVLYIYEDGSSYYSFFLNKNCPEGIPSDL